MNCVKILPIVAVVLLAAAARPASAESYVHLDRMPVVFNGSEAEARLMLVEITLAVRDEGEGALRRRSKQVQMAIHDALQRQPFEFYRHDNAAEAVKTVARRAAQKAAVDVPITDALIKSLHLR